MSLVIDQTRQELLSSLRRLERKLRDQGVIGLAIFGSRSRGDHRPDSDLDILIEVDPAHRFSMLDLVGVAHTMEDTLGIPTNVFMRRSLDPAIARSIERDIIEIY